MEQSVIWNPLIIINPIKTVYILGLQVHSQFILQHLSSQMINKMFLLSSFLLLLSIYSSYGKYYLLQVQEHGGTTANGVDYRDDKEETKTSCNKLILRRSLNIF